MEGFEPKSHSFAPADPLSYLEIPLRRPFHVVIPWILVTLAAVAVSYYLPKKYLSSTLILVERQEVPETIVQERTPSEGARRLQTLTQEIMSRTRLERVIKEVDPYPQDMARKPLTAILDAMRASIRVRIRGNDAFAIEYVHPNPEKAMAVANRLTTLFIEESTQARERNVEEASEFIESRLKEARQELEAKEESLRRFKEQHIGTLPEQLPANLATLQRLQLEQQGVGEDLRAAMGRLSAAETAVPPVVVGPSPAVEVPDLDRLKAELAALRTRYTDEHPDVQALLSRIARLEKTAAESPGSTGTSRLSPAIQQIRLEIRALQARQADIDRRVAVFEARVENTPRTEQELGTLTRDYEKLKENYLSILNKKMGARMAEKLEKQWQGDRFRILDPAQLPEQPIFPNRRLFLMGGLLLGLALGLATAVAAELFDPTVKTPAELEALLSEPLLGTVAHIRPGRVPGREPLPRPLEVSPPRPLEARAPRTQAVPAPRSPEVAPVAPPPAAVAPPPAPVAPPPAAVAPPPAAVAPPPAPVVPPAPVAAPQAPPIPVAAPPAPLARAYAPAPPAPPAAPPAPFAPEPFQPRASLEEAFDTDLLPPPAPAPSPAATHETAVLPTAAELWGELVAGSAPPAASRETTIPSPPPEAVRRPPALERPAEGAPLPRRSPIPPAAAEASPPGDLPRLLVDGGHLHGATLALEPDAEGLLGSAERCTLRLDLGNVEDVHARVVGHRRGIYISDAGSSHGTYVNGRRIQGDHLLRDGDMLFLGPPGSRQSAKLLVAVPTPSAAADSALAELPERPQVFHPVPAEAWATRRSDARRGAQRARRRIQIPVRKLLVPAAAAAVLGVVAVRAARGPAPVVMAVAPTQVEPGQTVSVSGRGFDEDPEGNTVHFGDRAGVIKVASSTRLEVTVPTFDGPSRVVPVRVETKGRQSNAVTLQLSPALRVLSLEPAVAQPGDVLTLAGENLQDGPLTVHVGGVLAEVLEASPKSVRFRIPPELALPEGTRVPVSVNVGIRGTGSSLHFMVGHLPLIAEVTPDRGPAGEQVTLKGYGFDPNPEGNTVTFGGRQALVFLATPTELLVAAPSPGTAAGQFPTDVAVQAHGSTSSSPAVFTLVRPPSAVFVPRFFPAPVPGHPGHGHAFVSTELGPVLLLSGPADGLDPARRAARVATVMNELVDASAKAIALDFRDRPAPAVVLAGEGESVVMATARALAGGGEPVVTATARILAGGGKSVVTATATRESVVTATAADANGYDEPWEGTPGPRGASPRTVAVYWTALLQDHLALFVQRERPIRTLQLSARGQVLTDLYTEGLRRDGPRAGVPAALVTPLLPSLATRMRKMTLLLPPDGEPTVAAAVAGRWQGTMEEGEAGPMRILVDLDLEANRLQGTLSMSTGETGVTLNTRLRELAYNRGVVSFRVAAGTKPLIFEGAVKDESMSGSIYSGAKTREPVGFFSLRYVQ